MNNTLFGIPLAFWGVGCLAIAAVYYQIWPMPNPTRIRPRSVWQHLVLRYAHSLVWILLAGACFLAGFGYGAFGLALAFAALPTYVIFLVVVVQDRQRELADQAAARRSASDAKSSETPPNPPALPTAKS